MKDRIHIVEFYPVKTDGNIEELCTLAEGIWHEHFTPIIGGAQVEYMVEKFQSVPAVTEQLRQGYEYFLLLWREEPWATQEFTRKTGSFFSASFICRRKIVGRDMPGRP